MKRILVPASLTVLTAAWAVSLGVAQDGTGGNRGTPQVVNQPVATTPSGADAPTANLLAAIGGGPTADGYLLQAAPFSVLLTLPHLPGQPFRSVQPARHVHLLDERRHG